QLRLQQTHERIAQHALRANAHSSLTALAPGQCLGVLPGLTRLEQRAQGRWLVLAVQAQGDRVQPYRNQFQAQPEATPYRPEWDTPLPEMAGHTQARLDTTDAANPYARVDGHGRYLAWHYFEHQRSQNGLGSAPIRLARDYAGPTYGQHFPVHAGVEAITGYVHGDPDRPVLLGVVHDSRNPNPVTAANASRHVLRTWANNKFRLEDKGGQTHVKISCEYGLSQLNLGHLVNQDRQQRGAGFELRTEHEGVLRAQKGWLLSTDATDVRSAPHHDPTGPGAQTHNAPLQDHLKAIRPWADNRAKAASQVGLEAASSLQGSDQLQKSLVGHKAPLQAWSSPVGIALSARKNLLLASEQTQGIYAQAAINLTSAAGLSLSAKKGVRIHAESGGLQQIVSEGDYTVHVQNGDLEVLAKQDVKFESKSGVIRLQTQGGQYFVEVGPKGLRIKAQQVINKAGVKVDYTGGAWSGQPSTSAGGAEGLGYFGVMKVKDTLLGEFKSSYAFEQLQAFARELDEPLFVLAMAPVFGHDIAPAAYKNLHRQIKEGSLKKPKYEVIYGSDARFDANTQTIEVGQDLARRAAQGESAAQWLLLNRLLQAFGEHVEFLLRQGSQGAPQEAERQDFYQLCQLDLEAGDSTSYGEFMGEGGGPLKVLHAPLQQALSQSKRADERAVQTRADALDNARFHDGVYRPERDGAATLIPVFDAQLNDGALPKGMFNHGSIEAAGLGRADFSQAQIAMVYYGNWLRDMSQLLADGLMLAPGRKPGFIKGSFTPEGLLSRDALTEVLVAFGEMRFTKRLLDAEAPAPYHDFIRFIPERLPQYQSRVGVYRPEEHIDNPAGLPEKYPTHYPTDWLVALPYPKSALGINPKTHLRNYIDTSTDAQHPSAVAYMCVQLQLAASLGSTPLGLMHLGNALHVLEDFYAHTNFIELLLRKLGHKEVICWVPPKPNLTDMPVTTGVFETIDALFSTGYKLADILFPMSDDAKRNSQRKIDGMPLSDWVQVRFLQGMGYPTIAKTLRWYSQIKTWVEEKGEGLVPEAVSKAYKQIKKLAYGIVNAGIKTTAQTLVRDEQKQNFDHATSIDPTHTLIAKDDMGHPLHELAASLAIEAIKDVGLIMRKVWAKSATSNELLVAASSYFVHPTLSMRFDALAKDWAGAHPQKLRQLTDHTFMKDRAKNPTHGDSAGDSHLPNPKPGNKLLEAQWNYATEHFAQLFDGADDLDQRMG
ncbi:HET-C-related protein, partial [Roseateles koreensis]